MTSRERVYATLDFQGPDRIPRDLWALPAAFMGRDAAVRAITGRYPTDIGHIPFANNFQIDFYPLGTAVDAWGCEWLTLKEGIIGEVKRSPFEHGYDAMRDYAWPRCAQAPDWAAQVAAALAPREKFSLAWAGNLFERMQFLRGTENLYADLADDDCGEVYELRDRVTGLIRENVELLLTTGVDAIQFSDDWGSQRSLLIRPQRWREFFKPAYKELCDLVRDAGKRIFFHSDGWIADIYPDFIELGVDAINSQVWCMGMDMVAPYAGRITFWGEMDRQHLLPHGTAEQIRAAAAQMVATLYRNGGLIGQGEIDGLTSLENIEALLDGWRTGHETATDAPATEESWTMYGKGL
jgi:uroporphyrinogen decarboxylase